MVRLYSNFHINRLTNKIVLIVLKKRPERFTQCLFITKKERYCTTYNSVNYNGITKKKAKGKQVNKEVT